MNKQEFEEECAEAVKRVVRGCHREGDEDKFYGGVSEFARIGGRVEIGLE